MRKKSQVSEADRALFRERAGDVRPLRGGGSRHPSPAPSRRPAPAPAPVRPASDEPSPDLPLPVQGGSGDVQHFARPGLQQKLLRRLRRGQIPVEDELDLHGMTAREAHPALLGFLDRCRSAGRRCVRVIHGKGHSSRGGRAVIKWQVDRWLRDQPEVLAFCSAPPGQGGTGALHLLLRR